MPEPVFEPMSVGGILDRAFQLYRQSFLRFLATVAIIQVPLYLLAMGWAALMFGGVATMRGEMSNEARILIGLFSALGGLLYMLLAIVGQQLSAAALLRGISERYLGRDVTVGEAYRFVWPKALSLIGAALLVGLITVLGLGLCVVPGVIFSLWYALTTPAIVIENRRATQGMSRSKDLVSGNLGRVFLVSLVVILITAVPKVMFQAGGELFARWAFGDNLVAVTVIQQLFQMIPAILVTPIGAAASVLLYYDLRIRKEGFDLEMLAERLAPAPTPETDGADA